MKKKVIVIGGGIAGLGSGIYAQKCGFDVTIFESHHLAGGNCTSWRRGDYLFEGGMHWLTGSGAKEQFNLLWRHTGALDDSVVIHYPEPFLEFNHEGTPIRLYRNVDTTERHLLELSPDDAKEIKRFCGYIRRMNLAMPVTDLRGVKVTKKMRIPLSMIPSVLSAISVMAGISGISRERYISGFHHEGLRELFRAFTAEKNGIIPLIFSMGGISHGGGGFPEGGSLPFVQRMVKTFASLGGKLLLNTRASRIITENNRAVAVIANDKRFDADAVIVTTDTMAIEHFFETPPKAQWLDEMRALTEPTMATFICLGIKADLGKYSRFGTFKLKEPIKLAQETYEYLSYNNYASDPVYSPKGKTALTVQLPGDTYDFWKKAKADNSYQKEKQKTADEVIAALGAQMPEIQGQVEVCDIATPLTYERYCANWKGSWMTEMRPGMKMVSYPSVIKGLEGVYFAGHRLLPPGGLPAALVTGRTAIQHLCRDTGTLFISEEQA